MSMFFEKPDQRFRLDDLLVFIEFSQYCGYAAFCIGFIVAKKVYYSTSIASPIFIGLFMTLSVGFLGGYLWSFFEVDTYLDMRTRAVNAVDGGFFHLTFGLIFTFGIPFLVFIMSTYLIRKICSSSNKAN